MPKHPKAVIFSLGIPEHGWLPVEFLCSELNLNFAASDVLNDPAGELCTVLMRLKSAGSGEVTWWLEPFTYVFSFERAGKLYALRVSEADDFDAPRRELAIVRGTYDEVLQPFRAAILGFYSETYAEAHWTYKADDIKLQQLTADD